MTRESRLFQKLDAGSGLDHGTIVGMVWQDIMESRGKRIGFHGRLQMVQFHMVC
jgi:hypothetical protein